MRVEFERNPRDERPGIIVVAYALIELHDHLMALRDNRSGTVSLPSARVSQDETVDAALRRGVESLGKRFEKADLYAVVEHLPVSGSEAYELAFLFDVTISGVDPFSLPEHVDIVWADSSVDADLGGLPAALRNAVLGGEAPLHAQWWPAVDSWRPGRRERVEEAILVRACRYGVDGAEGRLREHVRSVLATELPARVEALRRRTGMPLDTADTGDTASAEAWRALARQIADDAVGSWAERELTANRPLVSPEGERRVVTEVLDELLGMAGLQPLLDDCDGVNRPQMFVCCDRTVPASPWVG
jgi:hypothetical protein